MTTRTPYDRARDDCVQDGFENAPFGCVGGLDKRTSMVAPKWIEPEDREEYLRGYRDQALQSYGPNWQTCAFGWRPALTINEPPPPPSTDSGGTDG